MTALADIREGLASNLDALQGFQVSAYMLAQPTLPSIEVQPAQIQYDLAFQRGWDNWTLIVRVMVGSALDKGAQRHLDRMMASSGSESVKAAIEADTTLGGMVDDLQVTECTGARLMSREGGPMMLGAEWTVEVKAQG